MSKYRLAIAVGASSILVTIFGNLVPVPERTTPELQETALLTDIAATVESELPPQPASEPEPGSVAVSLYPSVVVINATPQQHRRLIEALERFRSANLPLPDFQVEFGTGTDSCGGHMGLFQPQLTPWRILICTGLDAVYEHELAHAWELANLDDDTRHEFMEHRGHELWNDPTTPWDERGVEGVAFIVQQGLVDLPLPPTLSAENRSRLVAYTILTGRPAPRLLRWIGLDSGDQRP